MFEIVPSGTGFFITTQEERDNQSEKKYIAYERYGWQKNIESIDRDLKYKMVLWLKPGQRVILWIDFAGIPIEKLAIKLNEKLKAEFLDNINTNMREIEIEGQIFYAQSTTYYANRSEYSPLISLSGFKNDKGLDTNSLVFILENSLLQQCILILDTRIAKKEVIYGKEKSYKKWLGILNTHPTFTEKEYQEAYAYMQQNNLIKHSFEKIFIVHDGQAYLLNN